MPDGLDYLVLGAGAAGLQTAYFLDRAGRSHLVLEASDEVGGFWRRLPRSRRLISFNKVSSVFEDPEMNLRWDWNSLLTDDHASPFSDVSRSLFPTGDEMADYLGRFARQHALRVALGSGATRVERDGDGRFAVSAGGGEHRARALIVATGMGKPYLPAIPGIEHAEGYEDLVLEPEEFAGQRVLVIGKGNSGFETANAAIGAAALVHVASPSPVRFSWRTRHSGHVRAHYAAIADMYQLKTLNTILDCRIDEIRALDDGSRAVTISFSHAEGQRQEAVYDRVIRCTGYGLDTEIFVPPCRPEMTIDGRFPALTEAWESVNVPGLFFAGTVTQSRDFQKTSSAFVAGFRYNIRTLCGLLEQRYAGVPLPARRLPLDVAALADAVLERTSRTSALWTQFGFLCDALVVDREAGEVRSHPELPVDYVQAGRLGDHPLVYMVTIEWGPLTGDPFSVERHPRPDEAEREFFLHPIVRCLADGEVVAEHHVLEDLFGLFHAGAETGTVAMRSELGIDRYHDEMHVQPMRRFLAASLSEGGAMPDPDNCHVVRPPESVETKQGLPFFAGVSAESAGAAGLCMHVGTIPPGGVAHPHVHEGHESAIYVLSGRAGFYYGAELEHEAFVGPGDFIYVGAGVPHQPYNASDSEPVRFVVSRTDPNEQESVVVLAHLEPRTPS